MSEYPLIRTKIRTPRLRPSLLRRARLVDFVHGNIQHKLILISASAGYGKTSLLIDYAHDTELPVCWYSLDRNDANALTFTEYLVAAIRERFPAFGASLLAYLEAQAGPPEDVEPIVRLLVHEIEENTGRYFAIILDDYHEVAESEPVNALLDGLLRYLPEHCHIILASRTIPRRLTLTRLAARMEVVGLGVEDLRFTADEIREFLRLLGYTDLPPQHVETLATRTEGWITGVLLAAQANRAGATKTILEVTGASAGVFAYMAGEILERQPPALQRFLLGSALFAQMSPALCNALLDIDDAAQILRDLADQNLFTIPLDAEGAWYQYHQIFREFLVTKLERDDPEGYRALCLKQAGILAHRGDWQSAVDSFLLAHAWEPAAEALEVIVQELFVAGQWDALLTRVDALPAEVLEAHPVLMLFRAKVHSDRMELPQSAALLERCYRVYLTRGDHVGAARVLVQSAVVHRFRGQSAEAIQAAQRALELSGSSDALTTLLARREIGIGRCMQGAVEEGVQDLQAALAAAQAAADDVNAAFIAVDLGTAEMSRGNLAGARGSYRQALLYWRRIGNESSLAVTLQNLGMAYHHLGQYGEAEAHLQEGLSKARAAHDPRAECYALTSLGDLYRDTRRFAEAQEHYRQALSLAEASSLHSLAAYVLDADADTRRLMGDLAGAAERLREALGLLEPGRAPYEEGLCRLSLGAVAAARGDTATAEESLQAALASLERAGSQRDVARAHLYLADHARAVGDAPALAEHLAAAARAAAEMGSAQFVVAEAPALEGLLAHAEREGLVGFDYARLREEIGRLVPREAPVAALGSSEATHPLEFLALAGGQVRKGGQVVTDWESTTARHLAFLFVAHPEGLRRDQVIELLWPDVSPEKGNSLFHSTIYRLRTALHKDFVVHRGGVYRVHPDCRYYYDAAVFQRLARQGTGSDEVAHAARVQALSLYQSPFLEDLDQEWCIATREALHTLATNLLIREGHYQAAQGNLQSAEGLFLRARALEAYDERAYRGLMWCRAARHDRTGAARQFRECARLLKRDLDVEPSQETLELYRAITSGVTELPLV